MSKIKINPKNKGKFNATKKATGKTTEELTHSKNPITKKRAVFAQNASHWNKKADGGYLPMYYDGGGTEINLNPQQGNMNWNTGEGPSGTEIQLTDLNLTLKYEELIPEEERDANKFGI